MKTNLIIFAVLILLSNRLFGQLIIDTGNDKIICVSVWAVDTTEIGGNPTATGGTEPYVYTWETNYNISDTSVNNPKAWPDISTHYQVIITDSIGCVSEPSIFSVRVTSLGISQPTKMVLLQI